VHYIYQFFLRLFAGDVCPYCIHFTFGLLRLLRHTRGAWCSIVDPQTALLTKVFQDLRHSFYRYWCL